MRARRSARLAIAVLSVLAVLILPACSRGYWAHPTATPQDLARDDYQCKLENRALGMSGGVPVRVTDRGMYARCMQIRGYVWTRRSASAD